MEKSEILTQSSGLIERFSRYRWSLGLAGAASALGMATAIAISYPENEPADIKTVVEQLTTQGIRPVDLGATGFFREERILRGDTVGNLMVRLGIQESEALEFIRTNPEARVMHKQLAPGKVVTARTGDNGELFSLHFPLNGKDSALVIERTNGHLVALEKALRYETQVLMKTAEIRSSLFAAADAGGIPDGIATQMAEIFSGDIDFHRDLRKDDRFTIIYEMHYLSGQQARTGRILAAEFINGGKIHRAIHFNQNGKSSYYTPEGKNLRKAFLRSPLEFSRVTSGFSMRFHPILQQWRAHKGVDYGAPPGTKVRATGDGVVDFVGQQGGYGNLVLVRHDRNYSTAYGHLRGFGPGIRKGVRVVQGETIGYVGQTGWATGPHLHYEFRINSQQVDPLALTLPTSLPLEGIQLARFQEHVAPLASRVELLRNTNLSALE